MLPTRSPSAIGDQVLAYLDQHMGKAVHRAVPVKAIVFQLAGIGLVVATTMSASRRKRPSAGAPGARLCPSRTPMCQGRFSPRQTGVKLWIETQDRHDTVAAASPR